MTPRRRNPKGHGRANDYLLVMRINGKNKYIGRYATPFERYVEYLRQTYRNGNIAISTNIIGGNKVYQARLRHIPIHAWDELRVLTEDQLEQMVKDESKIPAMLITCTIRSEHRERIHSIANQVGPILDECYPSELRTITAINEYCEAYLDDHYHEGCIIKPVQLDLGKLLTGRPGEKGKIYRSLPSNVIHCLLDNARSSARLTKERSTLEQYEFDRQAAAKMNEGKFEPYEKMPIFIPSCKIVDNLPDWLK